MSTLQPARLIDMLHTDATLLVVERCSEASDTVLNERVEWPEIPMVTSLIMTHTFTVTTSGSERANRLVAIRNKFILFALLSLAASAVLYGLSAVEALAPLAFFFGSLGSIVVLEMKISNVNQ